MKIAALLKIAGVFVLIGSLLACQDHLVEPQTPRFRVTQKFGRSQYAYGGNKVFQSWAIYTYTYDRAGRLAEVVYHYDPANLISGSTGSRRRCSMTRRGS